MKKMIIVWCVLFVVFVMIAQYSYRNLIVFAKSVNFKSECPNFYILLKKVQISNHGIVFFRTSIRLFKSVQSPLIKKMQQNYARLCLPRK